MKTITIKVYNPDTTFLKLWNKATFESFTKEINAGLGSCTIELGEPFDYQGNELQLGNIVEILISDKETLSLPTGYLLIYSGYISNYQPWVEGKKEGIRVYLLGHYTKLALDILKNGNQTTLYTDTTNGLTITGPGSAADIGKILKAIIGRYQTETVSPKLSYSEESIPDIGQTVEYLFEMKTYREAIDKVVGMTPIGWFWYVDENGMVYLKQKSTTPTHTFIFGTHFSKVVVERSMETIRNAILFWNGDAGVGAIYKLYKDDTSILQYGRRIEKYFDWAISSEPTASKIATKLIGENKDPEVKVTCELIDNNENPVNGYDIESIQPGDTCCFKGFNEQFADIFRENMLITKVVYYLNKVELTIEVTKSSLVDWLEKVDKKAEESYSEGAPTIYT